MRTLIFVLEIALLYGIILVKSAPETTPTISELIIDDSDKILINETEISNSTATTTTESGQQADNRAKQFLEILKLPGQFANFVQETLVDSYNAATYKYTTTTTIKPNITSIAKSNATTDEYDDYDREEPETTEKEELTTKKATLKVTPAASAAVTKAITTAETDPDDEDEDTEEENKISVK